MALAVALWPRRFLFIGPITKRSNSCRSHLRLCKPSSSTSTDVASARLIRFSLNSQGQRWQTSQRGHSDLTSICCRHDRLSPSTYRSRSCGSSFPDLCHGKIGRPICVQIPNRRRATHHKVACWTIKLAAAPIARPVPPNFHAPIVPKIAITAAAARFTEKTIFCCPAIARIYGGLPTAIPTICPMIITTRIVAAAAYSAPKTIANIGPGNISNAAAAINDGTAA